MSEIRFSRLETPKIFAVAIFLESGCNFDEGEFSWSISDLKGHLINREEMDLIDECLNNDLKASDFPNEEGVFEVTVTEDGEWEDVFWHSYFRVNKPTEIKDDSNEKPLNLCDPAY